MPAMNSFTANDRAATPVAHTFAPRGKDPVRTWGETAVIPSGENRATFRTRKTGSSSAERQKTTIRYSFPVVVTETINGVSVPRVVDTNYIDVNYNFSRNGLSQARKDAITMVLNSLVANGGFDTALVNCEDLW